MTVCVETYEETVAENLDDVAMSIEALSQSGTPSLKSFSCCRQADNMAANQ
jgi:hypothetical protein